MNESLAHRVASRYVRAFEFDSPKEREKYLKEHPKADPAKHTVKKQQKPKGRPEAPAGEKPVAPPKPEAENAPKEHATPEHGEKEHEAEPELHPPGRKVVDALKGLSQGALSFLKSAPSGVKKFFQDEGHRRKVLQGIHKAIEESPKKMASRLMETAREEVHEFKTAGQGIKAVWDGKKMSKHQREAVKKVAIHMGLTAVASAMAATGVVSALGIAAKSIAKTIAMKSVHRSFQHASTAEELHHIGHGLFHLFEKISADKKEPPPEMVLAAVVMQSVKEELAKFGPDEVKAVLESLGKSAAKKPVAKMASAGTDLATLCDEGETVLKGLRGWIRQFPQVLRQAQQEAVGLEGAGLVWQDRLVVYWRELDRPTEALESITDQMNSIPAGRGMALTYLVNACTSAISDRSMPRKARIEYAFSNPQFRDHPDRKGHIAYEVSRLEEWASEFDKWVEESISTLHQSARKARRLV